MAKKKKKAAKKAAKKSTSKAASSSTKAKKSGKSTAKAKTTKVKASKAKATAKKAVSKKKVSTKATAKKAKTAAAPKKVKASKAAPKSEAKSKAKTEAKPSKGAKASAKVKPQAQGKLEAKKPKKPVEPELLDEDWSDAAEMDVPAEFGTEEDLPIEGDGTEEVILTDAEGRRYCRVRDCDQLSSVDGYCRYHYLLYWKRIQVRKKILTEGKLEKYVEDLTARYPDKFLDMLRKDLKSEKEFLAAIQELEIDENAEDGDFEDEDQSFIDEVRGMSEAGGSSRDDDDY